MTRILPASTGRFALPVALVLLLPTVAGAPAAASAGAAGVRVSLSARSVPHGGSVVLRVRPAAATCAVRLHRGTSRGRVVSRRRLPRSGRLALRGLRVAGRHTVVARCGRRSAKASFVVRRPAGAAPSPGARPTPGPAGAGPPSGAAPARGGSGTGGATPTDPLRLSWEPVAPAPAPRGEAQGAAVGSRLFVFGGFTSGGPVSLPATARSDAYDAATNAWQPVADLPVVVTHAPAVVDGDTIWLVGGYVGDSPGPATDQVWRYSVVTNAWSPAPALPAARGAGGAAIAGGELHYFGGTSRGTGKGSPDEEEHWALRLDGGTTWEPRAPLPNPRNHLAAVTLGDRVYAIGGQHAENETTGNQRQVDAYDPATDAWTRVADLPSARGHVSSSAVVVGGRIVVVGGTDQGNTASASVEAYDPAANAWTTLPALPVGRKSPVAGLIGGDLYVATGSFRLPTLKGRLSP